MQLLRSIAGQLFIVFFIHSCHNVKIQAHPQSVLTASASSIGVEESVTLQCSAKAGNPPKKCWIFLISPTNGQKENIAFKCQETFTGSVLLAENRALAEVKVGCFYAVDVQSNTQPAPHSDIVSITVALPQSVLTASASSIREEELVTLQCSAKAGNPPKKCSIFLISPTHGQKYIASKCQETFTGSDLLAENWSLAEVKVGCFYADDRWKHPTAPHSDIVSITVRRALPQSVLTANASSIREEESVTLQCSAKAGHTPKKCLIYWFIQANDQNIIDLKCQATYTGSDLLARTGTHAERHRVYHCKKSCYCQSYASQAYVSPSYTSQAYVSQTYASQAYVSQTYASQAYVSQFYVSQFYASQSYASPSYASQFYASQSYASPSYASQSYASPSYASQSYVSPSYASPPYASQSYASPPYASPSYVSPSYASQSYISQYYHCGQNRGESQLSCPRQSYVNQSYHCCHNHGSLFLKAAIILIVCCGVIVFLIVLLFAVLQTWRRRKKNTMEMKSLNTGSSKVVDRSGSGIKKDGVYHVYSTISNEPSAPNHTLVYDLLQAN
ncbi:unnamed protein product [Boreogadus saida]